MAKLPSVSGERVVRALKRAGFVELRQKGSHVSLEKRTGERVWKTVVPMHSEVAKARSRTSSSSAGSRLPNAWNFCDVANIALESHNPNAAMLRRDLLKLALTKFFDLSNMRSVRWGAGENVWGLAMFSHRAIPIRRADGAGSRFALLV